MALKPMEWRGDHLALLDQRALPRKVEWLELRTAEAVARAIREMAVRGAPAIGVAAGYGLALALLEGVPFDQARKILAESRPTAVNLFWALERISRIEDPNFENVLFEAQSIEQEDLAMNRSIGQHGSVLIPDKSRVLTICNTGSLATAGHGTALGIIRTAHESGKEIFVYSCETRPRLQGLKLTAWELLADGIPFKSITDGAAGWLMKKQMVDLVIAGADRIAANGDTANKIGTYMLAVLAKHHHIPFYIAAPSSTFDQTISNGDLIPIEEREPSEITHIEGVAVAPDGTPVWNPGFDVTPGELISGIVTESGILKPPYRIQDLAAV